MNFLADKIIDTTLGTHIEFMIVAPVITVFGQRLTAIEALELAYDAPPLCLGSVLSKFEIAPWLIMLDADNSW